VREICERYGLTYTTGPLRKQYGSVLRKINRYALPRRAESAAARAKRDASVAALPVRTATPDSPAAQQPVRLAG
jgi:linoleoyl-CoA desaturase